MKLKIRPLTPDLWPALVDLFGAIGDCNGCSRGLQDCGPPLAPRPIMRFDLSG